MWESQEKLEKENSKLKSKGCVGVNKCGGRWLTEVRTVNAKF